MSAPALDIITPLRAAIIAEAAITSKLGKFSGDPSVHNRRPAPEGAEFPMVMIGPIVTRSNEDGINSFRPVIVIDIGIYGDAARDYWNVEAVAEAIYGLFHRQRNAISVTNYSVVDIVAQGPSPAPVDDLSRIGRRVTLTIRLYA